MQLPSSALRNPSSQPRSPGAREATGAPRAVSRRAFVRVRKSGEVCRHGVPAGQTKDNRPPRRSDAHGEGTEGAGSGAGAGDGGIGGRSGRLRWRSGQLGVVQSKSKGERGRMAKGWTHGMDGMDRPSLMRCCPGNWEARRKTGRGGRSAQAADAFAHRPPLARRDAKPPPHPQSLKEACAVPNWSMCVACRLSRGADISRASAGASSGQRISTRASREQFSGAGIGRERKRVSTTARQACEERTGDGHHHRGEPTQQQPT